MRIDDGRILTAHQRKNPYTGTSSLFDPIQVFTTPSLRYAERFFERKDVAEGFCVILQCRQKPGSFEIGPETIGAYARNEAICPNFPNKELEFMTKNNLSDLIVTRVLIWYLKMGDNPKHGIERDKLATQTKD